MPDPQPPPFKVTFVGPPPRREEPLVHECVCLLVEEVGDFKTHDKCHARVADPDSPFCDFCEQCRHPEAHAQAWEGVKREASGGPGVL